jgi:hypothetical protein
MGLCFVTSAATADGSRYASSSALSEGKWVKISVAETGFYKLTYPELRGMGFSNPEKVSIHGYGGWPMDENFATAIYLDDVPSTPVWRGADYLLFYGKGPVKWTAHPDSETFTHENNAYSTLGYYFVTDATETNEVQTIPSSTETPSVRIDTYDDHLVHEVDRYAITTPGRPFSGRDLFGEKFDQTTSQTFTFATPGITQDPGQIDFRFIAKLTSGSGEVALSVNGEELAISDRTLNGNDNAYVAATEITPKATWTGEKTENTAITLSFNRPQQSSHLDYIRLQIKRRLRAYGVCTFFRSFAARNRASEFVVQNATANTLVFDVTEGRPVQRMETTLNGNEAFFAIPASETLREFAIVDPAQSFATPGVIGEVKPQNLHGMAQTDMIILAPEAFVSEAERLAKMHRSRDNMTVAVVTPQQVYNEFSSGTPEATAIRRFMKMFYDRRTSDADAPKHLLLFGDGRHDNRKLTDVWKGSSDNYIITYQSSETLGESSYVSDDYFGFLEDDEGGDPVQTTICIGIGRFPVTTLAQARNAVNKVISYIESSGSGPWKNRLCFVADDGNAHDNYITEHMRQSNDIADYVENNHPEYLSQKLFFDAFKRVLSGGKPDYPDVRVNLQKAFKEGILIFNYTGHGDAASLAEERIVTQSDVVKATYTNLPLWIVSACDFAPFDASALSGGEDVFLNPKSGGIAIFAAARVAYRDENFHLHRLFIQNLFQKKENNGKHQTLGEVMKNAKNAYRNRRIKSFLLIGDPALTLAYPDGYKMETTEINGQPVTEEPVNFSAFQRITIKGEIRTFDGNRVNDFNGLLSTTVYDSQAQITTLNNNGITDDDRAPTTITYADYPNIMYIGNDSVRNGAFSFTFTVPKDISYLYQNGKINLYAVADNDHREANGSYKHFTVGGTSDQVTPDEEGPEVRAMYLNTFDFKDNDRVNETPMLIAIVWDESGINVGGAGIGHDITLIIDDDPNKSYTLNSYYGTYLEGKAGEGIIKFPIPKLEQGKHTAEFKVWDIHNNSSIHTIHFVVADNYRPSIIDLKATPSPAKDHVDFIISHDLPESMLNVELQVFDLNGRLQWKHTESGISYQSNACSVRWDLRNGAGVRLPAGVYIYRAVIRSNKWNEASKAKKLIILAQ